MRQTHSSMAYHADKLHHDYDAIDCQKDKLDGSLVKTVLDEWFSVQSVKEYDPHEVDEK